MGRTCTINHGKRQIIKIDLKFREFNAISNKNKSGKENGKQESQFRRWDGYRKRMNGDRNKWHSF